MMTFELKAWISMFLMWTTELKTKTINQWSEIMNLAVKGTGVKTEVTKTWTETAAPELTLQSNNIPTFVEVCL